MDELGGTWLVSNPVWVSICIIQVMFKEAGQWILQIEAVMGMAIV